MATQEKARTKLRNEYSGAKGKSAPGGRAVKGPADAEILQLNEGREPGHNVPSKGFAPRAKAQGKTVSKKMSPSNTSDKKQGPQ